MRTDDGVLSFWKTRHNFILPTPIPPRRKTWAAFGFSGHFLAMKSPLDTLAKNKPQLGNRPTGGLSSGLQAPFSHLSLFLQENPQPLGRSQGPHPSAPPSPPPHCAGVQGGANAGAATGWGLCREAGAFRGSTLRSRKPRLRNGESLSGGGRGGGRTRAPRLSAKGPAFHLGRPPSSMLTQLLGPRRDRGLSRGPAVQPGRPQVRVRPFLQHWREQPVATHWLQAG